MRKSIIVLLLVTGISSCTYKNEYYTEPVHQNWVFRRVGDTRWMPATVPGCVHTDLMANHVISDPFYRFREDSVQWIEQEDWEYHTTFDVCECLKEQTNFELFFEGLDTYADVYVNDSLVLKNDNMFVGQRISCRNLIHTGLNNLRIYFHSPVKIQEEKLKQYGFLPLALNEKMPEEKRTRVFTRKAPFHYGWDWGPRLVTCGIWRPVRFAAWSNACLDEVYLQPVSIQKGKADYVAHVSVRADKKLPVRLLLKIDGKEAIVPLDTTVTRGMNELHIPFSIPAPRLWWPNGMGEHYLYQVQVMLVSGRSLLDEKNRRLGVRTIELVQDKDSIGTSFYFKVNGIPVFMKGADYIPGDIFTTRVTKEKYEKLVKDAVNANMNMLRLWGGAIYEDDVFFDLLDENGILVWQDFMFACDMMPDDSLLLESIRKEAEYNVKRLRHHPCMALWCGNNENYRGWDEWHWRDKYPPEQAKRLWKAYEKIFYDILPSTVHRYHPEAAYWESSPQAGKNQRADRKSGDEHDWAIWFGQCPFSDYGREVPRFVSEYGVQSYPDMKTIRLFAEEQDLFYRSPVMEHRQRSKMDWIEKGLNGNGMIMRYIEMYYRKPKDFFAYVYLSQLMHGEGLKYAIETHRKNQPRCMGSLYWQINDCWPTMSWATIDYTGRWKGPHYFVKKANAPVIIVPEAKDKGTLTVHVVSEKQKSFDATVKLQVVDFYGRQKYFYAFPVKVKANTSTLCFEQKKFVEANNIHPYYVVCVASLYKQDSLITRNWTYFVPARQMPLPKPSLVVRTVKKTEEWYELEVSSSSLARGVYLYTDHVEGHFSDNFFDVLPGEKVRVKFFLQETDSPEAVFKVYSLTDSY